MLNKNNTKEYSDIGSNTNMIDILLIYPPLGSWDTFLRDIPLSIIYAATDSVKNGYNVVIFDCRLYGENWKEHLDQYLDRGCHLVGLSVMTGNPITTSLEISKYLKENYDIPVVWGGPHPTVLPEQTLENQYVDYVIRDWGSMPLCQLIAYIKDKQFKLDEITGLGFKKDGKIIMNPTTCEFEILDYRDIPYHLVDITSINYNRLANKIYFPIFTAVGCPYKCTFCMSPAVYKKIKGKKWIPFTVDSILEHIEYLLDKYNFTHLQVYDDDSFVDLERMRDFFTRYIERGFNKKIKLDFRGVRINELDKMDDNLMELMAAANVEMLAIGVETGSDDTLKRMKKGITVDQILRVSKKMAKYPTFRPHYNIFCGTPGETYEDLIKTKDLILTMAKDNPFCFFGFASDWKPLPGSVMTENAVKDYNLILPDNLEDWAKIDSFDADKITHPWYTKEINEFIKLLQIAGTILGKKVDLADDMDPKQLYRLKIYGFWAKLYLPILKFRLRNNITSFLIEYPIRNFLMKHLS
jgi:radical SAM superfamily enzyme YgiQ (UPF0313 family)